MSSDYENLLFQYPFLWKPKFAQHKFASPTLYQLTRCEHTINYTNIPVTKREESTPSTRVCLFNLLRAIGTWKQSTSPLTFFSRPPSSFKYSPSKAESFPQLCTHFLFHLQIRTLSASFLYVSDLQWGSVKFNNTDLNYKAFAIGIVKFVCFAYGMKLMTIIHGMATGHYTKHDKMDRILLDCCLATFLKHIFHQWLMRSVMK